MKYKHLYYLASPYSHPNREVMKYRANVVTKAAVDLLKQGIYVFAPIAYNSPWERYDLPGDWGFWENFDKAFVARMDAVIVLTLDGWEKSIGVSAEIAFAKEHGIPVHYVSVDQIACGDLQHIHELHTYRNCIG